MAASWYYVLDGQQVGPIESAVLTEMVKKGSLGPDAMIWREGMPDWIEVRKHPKLAALIPAPPAAAEAEADEWDLPLAPAPRGDEPIFQPVIPQSRPVATAAPRGGKQTLAYASRGPAGAAPPANYLVPAIFSVLFCCPLGVLAIINASKVNGRFQAGDRAGAESASESAKKYMTWAFVLGGISAALRVFAELAAGK